MSRLINALTGLLILAMAALALTAAFLASRAGPSDAVRYGVAAAALTVVVIGLQAWETRRTAEIADRALQQAQAGIAISERTALEAAKTRLDARAPRIHVTTGKPGWPPTRPPQFLYGALAEIGFDEQFHLPRDSSNQVVVGACGVIRNESEVSVTLTTNNLSFATRMDDAQGSRLVWDYPARIKEHVLRPGEKVEFCLRESRTVGEWAGALHSPGAEPSYVIGGEVIFSDPFDNGIVDNWRVELLGCPLEPVPDIEGAFRVSRDPRGGEILTPRVLPALRRYYYSKSSGSEFPQS